MPLESDRLSDDAPYFFGDFTLDPSQRRLVRGQNPIPLTPRAFDLLAVLVAHAPRAVSKDELLEKVWGKTVIEEGTLAWHMHAVRQALASDGIGADRDIIVTVPKFGYRFAPAVTRTTPLPPTPAPIAATIAEAADATVHPAPTLPTRRHDRLLFAGALGIGLLALAAAFFVWRSNPAANLPFSRRDWLLIADFENQTGDPRFDTALLTAITVSVEQSQFVNVFSRARSRATLQRMRRDENTQLDETNSREICAREGLRALLVPAITRTGSRYAITARLIDPRNGAAYRSYLVGATDETAILPGLQKLAANVRADLGESLGEISRANRPLAQVTTASLAALRAYSEGQEFSRRALFDDAELRFKEAVRLDPEFVMAHAALGIQYFGPARNRPDLGAEYFQRALALADRATERERMLIAADFAASRRKIDEALELYSAYSRSYPDDLGARLSVALLLLNNDRLPEAAAAYRSTIALDANNAISHANLALALTQLGEADNALAEFQRAQQLDPDLLDKWMYRSAYGIVLQNAGRNPEALRWFTDSVTQDPQNQRTYRALAFFEEFAGRYRDAEGHWREAIRHGTTPDTQIATSRNQAYLARNLAAQGRRKDALEQLRLAESTLAAVGQSSLFLSTRLVSAYAHQGALADARRLRDAVRNRPDAHQMENRNDICAMESDVALAAGSGHTAAPLATCNDPGSNGNGYELWLAAYARDRAAAGNADAAIASYRKLLALRSRAMHWEAQAEWVTAHLRLAQLLAQRGETAPALQLLGEFLEIWRQADGNLVLLKEAQMLHAKMTPRAIKGS